MDCSGRGMRVKIKVLGRAYFVFTNHNKYFVKVNSVSVSSCIVDYSLSFRYSFIKFVDNKYFTSLLQPDFFHGI